MSNFLLVPEDLRFMQNLAFFVFAILAMTHSNAQTVVFEKQLTLRRSISDKREIYPAQITSDSTRAIFLADNYSIHGLLLDRDYNLVSEIEANRPDGNVLLGSNFTKGTFHLFFASSNHKELTSLSLNFQDRSTSQNKVQLSLKKESYVTSVSYGGKFYFLTTVRGSSILKLYVFSDASHYESRAFEFQNKLFASSSLIMTLNDALKKEVVLLDNELPNPIDITSKKSKVYSFDDRIVITMDNQIRRTNVITIDLETLEARLRFFNHPIIDCASTSLASSNSYIHENLLYQLRVCPLEMSVLIRDLTTEQVIRELKASKDEEISFRNTPIQQEKETVWGDSERELSKTAQFLRKVAHAEAGLSVYTTNSGIEVTIGGIKELAHGSGGSMAPVIPSAINTPYGPVSNPSLYNPTYFAFNAYTGTRSVFFKSILERQTFNHQSGEVVMSKTPFDRIAEFSNRQKQTLAAKTVFRDGSFYLLAYYGQADKNFTIRKFR